LVPTWGGPKKTDRVNFGPPPFNPAKKGGPTHGIGQPALLRKKNIAPLQLDLGDQKAQALWSVGKEIAESGRWSDS